VTVDDSVTSQVSDTTTTVISTSINNAPTIGGATAGQAVNDNSTNTPFSGLTLAEVDPSQNVTVTVTVGNIAKGDFTSGSVSTAGFTNAGDGVYTFTKSLITSPFLIGGVEINRGADANSRPQFAFSGDGFHPAAGPHAKIAQIIVDAFRKRWPTANIPALPDSEILRDVLGL
jgi:hypothetical protein